MKTCRECGRQLPLEEFYVHPQMADGHLNFCKDCVRSRVRQHYRDNVDEMRERARKYGSQPENVRRLVISAQRWRKAFPERYKAHTALRNALRSGAVVRPDACSRCGAVGRVIGHHKDYGKPLEVDWLCQSCHVRLHKSRQLEVAA